MREANQEAQGFHDNLDANIGLKDAFESGPSPQPRRPEFVVPEIKVVQPEGENS